LARGDFHPTLSLGVQLSSKSYYDTIEKIVMKRSEGCKHCLGPLIKDKDRNELKADFRIFMRDARFIAYRYRKDALYRCHMTALIVGETTKAADQLTNSDQEDHIVTMMEHLRKTEALKKGRFSS
jgi:hypothetical protein